MNHKVSFVPFQHLCFNNVTTHVYPLLWTTFKFGVFFSRGFIKNLSEQGEVKSSFLIDHLNLRFFIFQEFISFFEFMIPRFCGRIL